VRLKRQGATAVPGVAGAPSVAQTRRLAPRLFSTTALPTQLCTGGSVLLPVLQPLVHQALEHLHHALVAAVVRAGSATARSTHQGLRKRFRPKHDS
jgi:hypothetical protein